jgi:hypothetical protein
MEEGIFNFHTARVDTWWEWIDEMKNDLRRSNVRVPGVCLSQLKMKMTNDETMDDELVK